MAEVKYPIGDFSFRYIRENGFLYIDKTEAIYKLTHYTKYYFLSRPRRFGKSLLVSTLEAYFRGQRQLFDGLAIATMEKEWTEHAVLRLDLSANDMSRCEDLNAYLHAKLGAYEDIYGQNSRKTSFGTRFKGIIQRAYEKTGRGVVILIDEYDNPMISTLGKPEVHKQMRTTLKGLYSVLKAKSEHIRFCFLTGITRFSKMSIFSGLNNLEDITLDLDYTDICGITLQEIENNCTEGIKALMQRKGWSYEQTLNRLRDYYDGYHFSKDSPDIYNPFSLLLALKKRDIQAYWNESGGRTEFLWKAISRRTESKPLNEVLSPILRYIEE
ncbi:MAG: AAA family ATPase [Muribaculaceae bacterium]|nr:AAA family ATPase [Muribaculaceae bacterium]